MIIRVEKARIDKFFAYFRTSIVTDIFVNTKQGLHSENRGLWGSRAGVTGWVS